MAVGHPWRTRGNTESKNTIARPGYALPRRVELYGHFVGRPIDQYTPYDHAVERPRLLFARANGDGATAAGMDKPPVQECHSALADIARRDHVRHRNVSRACDGKAHDRSRPKNAALMATKVFVGGVALLIHLVEEPVDFGSTRAKCIDQLT